MSKQPVSKMTDFGWYLSNLMTEYKIESLTDFSKKLKKSGYPISAQMLSQYRRDKHLAPPEFLTGLINAFKLKESEQHKLAKLWLEAQPMERQLALSTIWRLTKDYIQDLEEAKKYEDELQETEDSETSPPHRRA